MNIPYKKEKCRDYFLKTIFQRVERINSDAVLEGETAEGEDEIGNEEGITDVIEGSDAEDHVTDGTDGEEAAEVKDGAAQGEVLRDIVDGGDGNDDDGPDEGHEEP